MHLGLSQAQADAVGWRGSNQGSQLKAAGGWSDGGNGTNISGLSVLPGGYGYNNGDYNASGTDSYHWTATENGSELAWYRSLNNFLSTVSRYGDYGKNRAFSVRCIKN